MSEYTPITGKLRELLADINWTEILDHVHTNGGGICDGDWLDHWHEQVEHVCDAIDAVHAQLERENEALKAELDRVLGEQEDERHTAGESITGELREVAAKTECANGRCEKLYRGDLEHIADRIDAEHERQLGVLYRDMSDAEWVRLPVDADGVPWHVGDVNENGCTITTMCLTAHGWHFSNIQNDIDPSIHRHHQPDTWERIIADAVGCMDYEVERDDDLMDLVARCKALCERTKEEDE